MQPWVPFGAVLLAGVLALTALLVRRALPAPDRAFGWALWWATLVIAGLALVLATWEPAAGPGPAALPAPTP